MGAPCLICFPRNLQRNYAQLLLQNTHVFGPRFASFVVSANPLLKWALSCGRTRKVEPGRPPALALFARQALSRSPRIRDTIPHKVAIPPTTLITFIWERLPLYQMPGAASFARGHFLRLQDRSCRSPQRSHPRTATPNAQRHHFRKAAPAPTNKHLASRRSHHKATLSTW